MMQEQGDSKAQEQRDDMSVDRQDKSLVLKKFILPSFFEQEEAFSGVTK